MQIYDKGNSKRLVAELPMKRNHMFTLSLSGNKSKYLKATLNDESWLWHLIYCHLGFNGLQLLANKGMVQGLSMIHQRNEICEGFIPGKHHRVSFLRATSWRTSHPLQLVHSNICATMNTPSMS